jgi:hypothetical protein
MLGFEGRSGGLEVQIKHPLTATSDATTANLAAIPKPSALTSVRIPLTVHPEELNRRATELAALHAPAFGVLQKLPSPLLMSDQRRPLIVSDVPTTDDNMGFDPTIRTLANIVLSSSTDTPLAIAVNGQWGTGKTSILKMVESQARMLGFNCIWLNAWSLEQSEQLIAQVTQGLQEEIKRTGKSNSQFSQKLSDFVVEAIMTILPNNPVGGVARNLVNLSRTKKQVDLDISEIENVTNLNFSNAVGASGLRI